MACPRIPALRRLPSSAGSIATNCRSQPKLQWSTPSRTRGDYGVLRDIRVSG